MVNIKPDPDMEEALRGVETAAPSLVNSNDSAAPSGLSLLEAEIDIRSLKPMTNTTLKKKFSTKTFIADSESESESPPLSPATDELAHAKDEHDNDNDSDSDLSSLGLTPPPPTHELRKLETRHGGGKFNEFQVQCTHTGWCTCPAHASYPGLEIPHLSEWALSSMAVPVSALRTTLRLADWDLRAEGWKVRSMAAEAVEALVGLTSESADGKRADAEELVRHVVVCFPSRWQLLPGAVGRAERLRNVLRRWESDGNGNFTVLAGRLWEAVDGHPDLLCEFLPFFPEGAEAGVREIWERKDRARGLSMDDELTKGGGA